MELSLIILYLLAVYRLRLILPALMLHAVLIVSTAMQYGRMPLIGMHDTLGFLAFSIGTCALIAGWNRKRDLFSYVTITLILLLLAGSAA